MPALADIEVYARQAQAAIDHLPVGPSMFDGEERLIICNPAYRAMSDLDDDLFRPGTPFSSIVFDLRRIRPLITTIAIVVVGGDTFRSLLRITNAGGTGAPIQSR